MHQEKKQSEPSTLRTGIRLGNALVLLNLIDVIFILIVIFLQPNLLRTILAIPFLLFFPGYALQVAIFPRKGEISTTERVVLSIGLSVVTVALLGFILNFTPWGIKLEPVLDMIVLFIFLTSVIAWQRQKALPEDKKFSIRINLTLPDFGRNTRNKVITFALLLAILGALGTLAYLIATPGAGETYTEFYILGQQGKSGDYPDTLKVGEEGRVAVGIINHEKIEVSYSIKVLVSGNLNSTLGPVVLANGQNWEGVANFIPTAAGENEEVQFLLYKDGGDEPYRDLHLWLNFIE